MTTATQSYGATIQCLDGIWTMTSVFPVAADWRGYEFSGYCCATEAEYRAFCAGEEVAA